MIRATSQLPMLASSLPLLAKHRLTTPIAAIDLDELDQSVRSMEDSHLECGIAWRPMVASPLVPTQIGVLRRARIAAISLRSLPSFDFAVFKNFDVDLLRPPITLGGAGLLADALDQTTVAVACDHFAQVEPLARAAAEAGREIVIDLRVSAQRGDWGVLPGPELENLARGISRLPAARLRGLVLPAHDTNGAADSFASSKVGRLALAGAASLHKTGHRPEILLVDNLEDGRRLSAELPDISCASLTPLPDARLVLAGVIARPSREVAILDAGAAELGSTPSLVSNYFWRVEMIQTHVTSLRCDVSGDNMAIGDVLLVRPSPDARLSRNAPRLLKRQGVWTLAPK